MTGHISFINLASEVPPVVESVGVFPVTFFTDLTKDFTNLSGLYKMVYLKKLYFVIFYQG